MKPTVLIIQEHLPAFRLPFYQLLRRELSTRGIELQLVFAPNQRNTFLKAPLDWAIGIPIRWFGPLGWQPALSIARKADLVIVQQETKYALNPVLQLLATLGGTPVAYWGHGRNFQSPEKAGPATAIKNFLATKVHWWFAYNDLSARIVRDLGFPAERITAVGNAVDTTGLLERRNSLTGDGLRVLRESLGIHSEHVAVYTGGLYANKRISFLIESALRIREQVPDFELIVIGDGPDRHLVTSASRIHPWIHDVGPKNDKDKVPYWAISKLLLMPGLVGLVVVDSFALGTPLVTTDFPYHSPEIDYLKHDVNGLIVECGDSADVYATEVAELLRDTERLKRLSDAATASAADHTTENMARSFAEGICSCLEGRYHA